jgi:hypothetical protein
MKDKKLLIGGLAAAAVGYYLWSKHTQAQLQILAQPVVQPVPGTSAALPAVVPNYGAPQPIVSAPVPTPIPPAPSSTGQPTVPQMAAALIDQWANQCKNPPIMIQLVGLLTDSETASLYNILTTQWEMGTPATATSTAFWNQLRAKYPCLNTSGVGCSSPTSCV